jgi:hypothetical protein
MEPALNAPFIGRSTGGAGLRKMGSGLGRSPKYWAIVCRGWGGSPRTLLETQPGVAERSADPQVETEIGAMGAVAAKPGTTSPKTVLRSIGRLPEVPVFRLVEFSSTLFAAMAL